MAYVEKEKVLEIAKDKYYSDFHKSMADLTSLRELLEDTPTADVVEVRHGYWEQGDYYDIGDVCSECEYDSHLILCKYKYCPQCGAKMDGKDGE